MTPQLADGVRHPRAFVPRAIRETLRRFVAWQVAGVVPLRKREGSGKERIGHIYLHRPGAE